MKSDGGSFIAIGLAVMLAGCLPLLLGRFIAVRTDAGLTEAMLAANVVGGFAVALGLLSGWRRVNAFSVPQRDRLGADRTELLR
jgi:hypothetical protein